MRPYFELIRVYLVPTALADSWAGYFIGYHLARVSGATAEQLGPTSPGNLVLIGLLSAASYAFGMVTNDIFDVAKDRSANRTRPIVNGEVSLPSAKCSATFLAAAAVLLAIVLDVEWYAFHLLAVIFAYNVGGKNIWGVGSLLMGSCRGLNLLTGAAAVPIALLGANEVRLLCIPVLALGAYVAIVTSISLQEDRPYNRLVLRLTSSALLFMPVALAIWASRLSPWGSGLEAWLNAAAFAICLIPILRLPREDERREGAPHPAARVVRTALGALYFFDAGLLWCFGQREAALGLYVLFAVGWTLKWWWLKSR